MRYPSKFGSLFVVIFAMALSGCATTRETDSSPNASSQEVDPNFIPASRISAQKLGKLWNVATNKCYDFGYSVANNDRATRNLVCTTVSRGNTLTLRVRFADEGIYVNLQSSSADWALFGKNLGPMTKEHKEMKAAMIAGLRQNP